MKSAGVFSENFKLYKHSLGKMTGKLYIKLKSKKIIDNRQIRVYIIDMQNVICNILLRGEAVFFSGMLQELSTQCRANKAFW